MTDEKTLQGGVEDPASSQEIAAAVSLQPDVSESTEQSQKDSKKEELEKPAQLTPAEQFAATKKIVFIAPDVPPTPPRPRRSELQKIDDLLEQISSYQNNDSARMGDRQQRAGERELARESRVDAREEVAAAFAQSKKQQEAPIRDRVQQEPQRINGSTRLEAKKQRRRDNRESSRRRTVITESEFLARRESVDRRMIVNNKDGLVQIGVLEDKILVEHYVARADEKSLIGNIYLGKVQNVLPGMEAAFVDIGEERNAVLYAGEVDWSEYSGSHHSRKIDKLLKPGDPVLVQVTKDPVGHKGARLTSQISLSGRFLVLVPGGSANGISRKLPDTERTRLKKILKDIVPGGSGVIVRTASEGASEEQLTRDMKTLKERWEGISQQAEKSSAPVCLHAEPDTLIKIIRDVFNEDFQKLVIDAEQVYETIVSYLEKIAPELLPRVSLHTGERDAFAKYRVSEQIKKALDRKVWLPSGGSLVIDRTEAMTVIDVNTGKFVGAGGNLEETVTKNNLEAAEEIVRQLRLRDIGGIIVVDFIDMVLENNRELVHRRFVECLGRDRTKHQVAEVTSLGLVQMTRKKIGLGLLESFSSACETCQGRGVVVADSPVSHKPQNANGAKKNKRSGAAAKELKSDFSNKIAQIAAASSTAVKTEYEPDAAVVDESSAQSSVSSEAHAEAAAEAKKSVNKKPQQKNQSGTSSETSEISDAVSQAQESSAPQSPAKKTSRRVSRRVVKRTSDEAASVDSDSGGDNGGFPAVAAAEQPASGNTSAEQPESADSAPVIHLDDAVAAADSPDEVLPSSEHHESDTDSAVDTSGEPHIRVDPSVAYEAVFGLFPEFDKRPKKTPRPKDGGAEDLIKRYGDKGRGLYDILEALPDPNSAGIGRPDRVRSEAEFKARMERVLGGSKHGEEGDSEASAQLGLSLLDELLDRTYSSDESDGLEQ